MPPRTKRGATDDEKAMVPPPQAASGIYSPEELDAMTEDQRRSIQVGNDFAGVVPVSVAPTGTLDDKDEVMSDPSIVTAPVVNDRENTVTLSGEQYRTWVSSMAREEVKKSVITSKMAKVSLDDAGDSLERDVVKACKLMSNCDVKPFDGSTAVDVLVWLMKFKTAMLLRWIHPSIFHRLAFQYVTGVALSVVEKVLATDACPANYEAFSSLLINRFPPTITKSSIKEEYTTFKMQPSESVTDYYDRFLILEDRAESIKFARESVSEFVEGLIPSLRDAVDMEIDRRVGANEVVDLANIALWTIIKDNRYRARKTRERVNNVGESSSSGANKKRKATPRAEGVERKCYNCDKAGHIAADCTAPKSEKSKAYLAAKAKGKEKA